MKVDAVYPSRYLRAADLEGKSILVTIKSVAVQQFDGDENDKLLLHFVEDIKDFLANKTNAMVIASFLGDETDAWAGHKIVLFPTEVNFGGRMVAAIRCRAPKVKPAPSRLPAPPPTPPQSPSAALPEPDDDDVPF